MCTALRGDINIGVNKLCLIIFPFMFYFKILLLLNAPPKKFLKKILLTISLFRKVINAQ